MGLDESIYDNVIGEAVLEIRKDLIYPCNKNCTDILDCLYCENCYFKITCDNESIGTFNGITKAPSDDDFEILFYDYTPDIEDMYSYLFSDDSSYRIIKIKDSEIVLDHFVNKRDKILVNNNINRKCIWR